MAKDVMGDAADQELVRRPVTARAKHDDVGTKLLSLGDDPLSGIALDEKRRYVLSAPAQRFRVALQQLVLRMETPADMLADAVGSRLPADEGWIRLGNVDEPQPGTAGACEPRCRLYDRSGRRRQIESDDDRFRRLLNLRTHLRTLAFTCPEQP